VLNWQAPATFAVNHYDIYRDGLLAGSTTGAATTYTDASASEGTHDYAVLARDAAAKPACSPPRSRWSYDKTAPTSGRLADRAGDDVRRGHLVWPAAGDALSGVAGYTRAPHQRTRVAPAAADGGIAVCAPAQPGCVDSSAATGTWSYGVFARDAAGNVAQIGTVSNVVVVDKTAPPARPS